METMREKTLRQANKEIYWAWKSMKQRTQNPKCSAYKNYGARGIQVCNKWQKFEPFCEWALSSGWVKGLDLDRIDNNGNYCPENCRWATRQDNVNNRRITIVLTVNGKSFPCAEWEKETGIPRGSLKVWTETKGKEYAENRIKEALKDGYIPKNYAYSHCKPIKDIKTGEKYNSIRSASRTLKISYSKIARDLNSGKGRYTYEVLD